MKYGVPCSNCEPVCLWVARCDTLKQTGRALRKGVPDGMEETERKTKTKTERQPRFF